MRNFLFLPLLLIFLAPSSAFSYKHVVQKKARAYNLLEIDRSENWRMAPASFEKAFFERGMILDYSKDQLIAQRRGFLGGRRRKIPCVVTLVSDGKDHYGVQSFVLAFYAYNEVYVEFEGSVPNRNNMDGETVSITSLNPGGAEARFSTQYKSEGDAYSYYGLTEILEFGERKAVLSDQYEGDTYPNPRFRCEFE